VLNLITMQHMLSALPFSKASFTIAWAISFVVLPSWQQSTAY
jgi:hypothetical protein|tara:strand:- start:936 stop:1061 length:126 start_codon:yes stop_codon:yes gene_type:complete